ncbi:MAG TPA: MarR family transcriptional regulator [Rhodanobacteraceae bacterium]|jgi:MarR family transcriptional repressor of emrRAB|nr:MarR family transcriptional regulator [Rhodanobacteraceae bacterium]
MEAGLDRIAGHVPQLPLAEIVLIRLLLLVGGVLAEQFERTIKPHGLSESDFRTLIVLFASPGGRAHPGELCQYATQTPANMTRIGDGLVRRGLVTRARSEEDRRRVVLRITPAGRALARKLLPRLFPRARNAFAGFDATERRRFGRLLHKLVHNLDAMDAGRGTRA